MKTHQFKLEFIFGKGISSFPPGKVPIEADIVRRWVFDYDRMRGDRLRPGEAFQHEVIFCVVDELMDFWKINVDHPIRPRWKVFTKVKAIVDRVQPLMAYVRQRDNPENHQEWIEYQLSCFQSECDISEDGVEKRVPKNTRKFEEEDPDFPGPSSKKAFVVGESSDVDMASGSEDNTDDSDDLSDDLSEEVSSSYDNRCTLVFRNTIAMIQRLNARGANISPGMTAFIIGAVGQDWVSIHEYMLYVIFLDICKLFFSIPGYCYSLNVSISS